MQEQDIIQEHGNEIGCLGKGMAEIEEGMAPLRRLGVNHRFGVWELIALG